MRGPGHDLVSLVFFSSEKVHIGDGSEPSTRQVALMLVPSCSLASTVPVPDMEASRHRADGILTSGIPPTRGRGIVDGSSPRWLDRFAWRN